MARVKNGAVTKARHKKVLKAAKGYFGSKHRLYKTAKEQLMHSGQYDSEIENKRRENSENYGLLVSMLHVELMILVIQDLLKD